MPLVATKGFAYAEHGLGVGVLLAIVVVVVVVVVLAVVGLVVVGWLEVLDDGLDERLDEVVKERLEDRLEDGKEEVVPALNELEAVVDVMCCAIGELMIVELPLLAAGANPDEVRDVLGILLGMELGLIRFEDELREGLADARKEAADELLPVPIEELEDPDLGTETVVEILGLVDKTTLVPGDVDGRREVPNVSIVMDESRSNGLAGSRDEADDNGLEDIEDESNVRDADEDEAVD